MTLLVKEHDRSDYSFELTLGRNNEFTCSSKNRMGDAKEGKKIISQFVEI